jgi:hypothetical protein
MILIRVQERYGREAWINPEHIVSVTAMKDTTTSEPTQLEIRMDDGGTAYFVDRDEFKTRYPAMFHGGLTDEDDDTDDTPTIDAALQDYRKGQI